MPEPGPDTARTARCRDCAAELAPGLLACPACRALVHKLELERLAAEAQQAENAGDRRLAAARWRDALALLPHDSAQHASIRGRIESLSRELAELPTATTDAAAASTASGKGAKAGGKGAWGALAVIGALLFKFKGFVFLALSKLKFLLLGLKQLSTMGSMLLTFGLYWTQHGWPFAAGLVLSIYVHEIGHVAALHHFGIRASAPMFIPGFGAFVRLQQYPATPHEDARVGLAGPIWGLAAAAAALAGGFLFDLPVLLAVAQVGAWINLFNLIPVWQLDGSRGFRALSRVERVIAVLAIAATWAWTRQGLLLVIGLVALVRVFGRTDAPDGDRSVSAWFVFLVVVLSALAHLIPAGIRPH